MNEVVEKILAIANTLSTRSACHDETLTEEEQKQERIWQPSQIQNAMFKLAMYKTYLGEIVDKLEMDYQLLKDYNDIKEAKKIKELIGLGMKKGESDNEAKIFMEEDRIKEAHAKYNYKLIKRVCDDAGIDITVLQSRLKRITGEETQERQAQSVN